MQLHDVCLNCGHKNMTIVQMVPDVAMIYALVGDLGQHSCSMARTTYKFEIRQFFLFIELATF